MKVPFENDNGKIVSRLAGRSFRANLLRNIVAVTAIVLTAVLFASVTTIGLGTLESMQLNMQRQKMSRSDAELRYMTAEQYELLKNSDMVKKAGLRRPIGYLRNSVQHNIELNVMDNTQMELVFAMPSHGKPPETANQLVTSDRALRDLGVEPKVGAELTIEFTAHGRDYSLPMVVSGWYEALNDQLSIMALAPGFVDAYPEVFQDTHQEDAEMAGTYFSDILVKNRVGLEAQLDAFVRAAGGVRDDMQAPNYLPATVNQVTNPTLNAGTVAIAVLFILLFITCGYLLIYNVFDISVMQSVRQYGLYRTVGMSKKQVKQLINRQALWLGCIGTPIGLLIGYFVGRASLPKIMALVATEYRSLSAGVSPNPLIFLGAALLTAFTVWMSTRKPVRKAVNIPPIEAFRYVETATGKKQRKRSVSGAKVSRMALSNVKRNSRRTVFIVVSLTLCVILLNSVGVIAGSVDVEKQVRNFIRTDFAVVNVNSMSNFAGFRFRSDALSRDVVEAINAQPGVEDGTLIYKNTLDDLNVTYDYGQRIDEKYPDPGMEGRLIGDTEGLSFPLGADGYPSCNVYGMDKVALSRLNIVEGETDVELLYQKITTGDGVIVGIGSDMKTDLPNEILDIVDLGDTIRARVDGKEVRSYTVVAKASFNGDDMEIGSTSAGFHDIGGDAPALCLPFEQFQQLYTQPTLMKYSFNVADEQEAAMSAFLQNYMKSIDPSVSYLSAALARQGAESIKTMVSFVGGIIGLIFGVAGILNLANMLITGILARRHEFATMQSIGMTKKQLTSMVMLESLYYAAMASLAGMVLSAVAGGTVVKNFCATQWNFTYHFTLVPAVCVCVVLLVFSLLIPLLAMRLFHKASITEQLRQAA